MREPSASPTLSVFGLAIITGTLVAQYFVPAVDPWPGLVTGMVLIGGVPAVRAFVRGIGRVLTDATSDGSKDE